MLDSIINNLTYFFSKLPRYSVLDISDNVSNCIIGKLSLKDSTRAVLPTPGALDIKRLERYFFLERFSLTLVLFHVQRYFFAF